MRQLYALQLRLPGATMNPQGLVGGNVGVLPFANSSFDLAISNAAFEHFLDVPAVLADLQRVLRPGGDLGRGSPLYESLGRAQREFHPVSAAQSAPRC